MNRKEIHELKRQMDDNDLSVDRRAEIETEMSCRSKESQLRGHIPNDFHKHWKRSWLIAIMPTYQIIQEVLLIVQFRQSIKLMLSSLVKLQITRHLW